MKRTEQLKNSPLLAARRTTADPSSGQGGGAKVIDSEVVTYLPAVTCRKSRREYFNKIKKPARAERPRRGQPPKLTPEMKYTICMLVCLGMSRREAARFIGIDHSTISRASLRDTDFAAALKEAKELRAVEPQIAGGGWRADARRMEQRSMLAAIPLDCFVFR